MTKSKITITAAASLALGAVGALLARRRGRAPEPPRPARSVGRDDPATSVVDPEYSCDCGQDYRFTGEGRHRVYWPADAAISDPVMGDECPRCDAPLPKETAAAATR